MFFVNRAACLPGASSCTVDVNDVRIHARDGAAIKDVDIVTITAIEYADVVMVDLAKISFGLKTCTRTDLLPCWGRQARSTVRPHQGYAE